MTPAELILSVVHITTECAILYQMHVCLSRACRFDLDWARQIMSVTVASGGGGDPRICQVGFGFLVIMCDLHNVTLHQHVLTHDSSAPPGQAQSDCAEAANQHSGQPCVHCSACSSTPCPGAVLVWSQEPCLILTLAVNPGPPLLPLLHAATPLMHAV